MKQSKAAKMTLSALMAALLCVCAVVVIPVGAVPFSLGVFGVCFAGALQSPAWAAASVGVYLALGCVGLPVFAGFRAGPQTFAGPTGGFLAAYVLLALAVSLGGKLRAGALGLLLGAAAGLAALHLCGAAWFAVSTGATFSAALAVCTAPFLLSDIAKCAAAVALAVVLRRRIAQQTNNG